MDTALTDNLFSSTAAFGDNIATSNADTSALGDHLTSCKGARGRLFALRCLADNMDGFVASRIVSVMSVAIALGLAAAVLVF